MNSSNKDAIQVWRKSRSYTDEKISLIPDSIGFWDGKILTLDNLEEGGYYLKFITAYGVLKGQVNIDVSSIKRKFEVSVPEECRYIEVYNLSHEKKGVIRTSAVYRSTEGGTGADGKSAYQSWLD
ncbi:MAG: hypothetical protein IJD80_03355, partial [Oscillospiraceae bacterium]|nr:hypothetical protein [Oscillospiraceae bacterium]